MRRATPADRPVIEQLLEQCELITHALPAWIDHFWVAEENGVVVGVAGLEFYEDGCLLRSVAVLPECRSTGLGRRLVERALEHAVSMGARNAYLLTLTAEGWFPRLGFTPIDRAAVPASVRASGEFQGACPASALVMFKPLVDGSALQPAQANLSLHLSWVQSRTPGMLVRDDADLLLSDCGLPTDTFSTISRARIQPQRLGARIAEAIGHFRAAGRPFSWWVGPGDGPAQLGAGLERAGLVPAETELAMTADLASLTAAPLPAELRIERATTPAAIDDFSRVNAANWSPADAAVIEFYRRATPALLDASAPLRLYVGYVGNEPVATAQAAIAGGVVGLYNIATLAEYRRRGFGTALTLAPLLDARAEGITKAVLQASADGQGVYARIGFRPTGRYTEYQPPRSWRTESLAADSLASAAGEG